MLKKSSIKKISLAAFCLLILLILYLFPRASEKTESINPKTTYSVKNVQDTIYLIDKNDMWQE